MVLAKDIETADYIAFAKNVTLPSHCFLNVQVTTKKLSSQEYRTIQRRLFGSKLCVLSTFGLKNDEGKGF